MKTLYIIIVSVRHPSQSSMNQDMGWPWKDRFNITTKNVTRQRFRLYFILFLLLAAATHSCKIKSGPIRGQYSGQKPVLGEGRGERDSLKTVCRLQLHNRVSLRIMLVNLETDKFFVQSQVIKSQLKNIGEIYRQIWTQHLWNRDSLNRKTNLQLDLCYYCFCVVRIHLQEKSR